MPDDGGRLVVNFAALHQAAADINSAIGKMEQQLSDVEASASTLVASWTGDAQESYHERQRRWRSASNDLAQMLRDIKVAVEAAAEDFTVTENRNKALFT